MSSQPVMSTDSARTGSSPGSERRRHDRLPYATQIHYGSMQLVMAEGVDLSFGGVGFVAQNEIQLGDEVEVAFLDRGVAVRGTVRNLRAVDEGFRVGVQFNTDEREVVEVVLRYGG